MREATALRVAVVAACAVPLLAGGAGVIWGSGFLGIPAAMQVSADSHIRYLSGLLLAIGLGFLSTVPRIEQQGPRFRLLTAIVVLGGLARLGGLLAHGVPQLPMLAGLGMELVVTPLLCIWRGRVARLLDKVGT